jgi:hypothetical protein
MSKSALFPGLDKQDKQLKHIKSLTSVLLLAGGSDELMKHDLCGCLSLLHHLAENAQAQQTTIVDGLIKFGTEIGA